MRIHIIAIIQFYNYYNNIFFLNYIDRINYQSTEDDIEIV